MTGLARSLPSRNGEFGHTHESTFMAMLLSSTKSVHAWLRQYVTVLAVYIGATWLTNATFMSDTVDYVDSITAFTQGVNYNFWEFGHLLWRPSGWALSRILKPITTMFVGPDPNLNVTLTLMGISWLAGLLCVLLLHSLVSHVCGRRWIANLVTIAFVFSQGLLNYAQAGTSYIPGLSLLLLGLYILVTSADKLQPTWATPLLAGLALAGAVCLWIPYVLAIPAVVLSPLLVYGSDRRRWRSVLQTSVTFAGFTGLAYASVVAGLGLYSLEGIRKWVTVSSHGTDFRGTTRVVFGFARSFINMGNDGLLFKRYLLSDPFNPVSLADLLRLSLWKLALFYAFLGSILVNLFYSRQSKRVLILSIASGVPVIVFAIFFAGSDIERYLALYPAMFLSLAVCLRSDKAWPASKAIIFAFVAAMIVTNASAMAKVVLDRRQDSAAARIRDLLPRVDSRDRVFVANWQDDLINFSRAYPFHPVNRSGNLHLNALVTPGTSENLRWRKDFASRTLSAWRQGGAIWISRRVLSRTPRAEWSWAEGDDRRVSWTDFPALFSQLDVGESAGGAEGFMRLLRSSKNERFLVALAESKTRAEETYGH